MEISVVIPAYNEQENLRETVESCVPALRQQFDRFEIIIVDDQSTDATGKLADELSLQYHEVKVIHNARNLGQGASCVQGFREARYELVTHNAMDYPFHLEDLSKVLPLLEGAEVVVVARRRRPESSAYRRLLTAVNLALLRNCFGLRLRDYNFVQIYKREVLESIDFRETSTGFLAPSILFQAHRLGYRIEEIELDYWPREKGEAKSGHPKVVLATLRDLASFWIRDRHLWKRRVCPPFEARKRQALRPWDRRGVFRRSAGRDRFCHRPE